MSALNRLFEEQFEEHLEVTKKSAEVLFPECERLVDICLSALSSGCKIIFFGNGGSAADAQHWATELTVRFNRNRSAYAAIALTTDGSALTAIGNDLGFEQIFARQIEALARRGDVAIGITTSGKSPNVLNGLRIARLIGCQTVAFTGKSGIVLNSLADVILAVPSKETARIQEVHGILGHILCKAIEDRSESHPRPGASQVG